MFYIKGTIKDDKIDKFVRKDGSPGQKRLLYIEPLNSIYPITVSVPEGIDYGKIGSKVELRVKIYPFSYVNKERRRAFLSIYVPEEKSTE